MMLALFKDEEEVKNGSWAGNKQIWNKYLTDLFRKRLTPLHQTLHVDKMWAERVHIVLKSLFQVTNIYFFNPKS